MYFIGIDIGIHETVVARTPGYNSSPISVIPLELNNGIKTTVLKTALNKSNDMYSLLSKEDFEALKFEDRDQTSTLLEGFIKATEDMTPIDKESMIVFTKLLLQTIMESDHDLNDNNYIIGITCRHCFNNLSYIDFLKKECKLYNCIFIDDLYAAKYMQHKTYADYKNILVINIDPIAVDFKSYLDSEICDKNSYNVNYGFDKVYNTLKHMILSYGDNKRNIQYLIHQSQTPLQCIVERKIESLIEEKIRGYYQCRFENLEFSIRYAELLPIWSGDESDICVKFYLSKNELNELTINYHLGLCDILTNIYTKLALANSKPDKVMLIGEYCNIDFIQSSISKIFNVPISEHYKIEYEVAMGIAYYVHDMYHAKENLQVVIQNKIKNFGILSVTDEKSLQHLYKFIVGCINDELNIFNEHCKTDEKDILNAIFRLLTHSLCLDMYEWNTHFRNNLISKAMEIFESNLPHAIYSPELQYSIYKF